MSYFIYTSHHFTPHGRMNWINLIFLAPNVWLHSSVGRASHRYRGGLGFESRWSLDFFRLLLSNCLNWKIYCDDHSSLWSTTAVQIYELFHIYFTSFYSSRENELNKLTSLPMCGFIAHWVGRASHRYRGGHGFESRWSLDFFRLLSNCLKIGKFTAIILHFDNLFWRNQYICIRRLFTHEQFDKSSSQSS